jgi:hypothetical protein
MFLIRMITLTVMALLVGCTLNPPPPPPPIAAHTPTGTATPTNTPTDIPTPTDAPTATDIPTSTSTATAVQSRCAGRPPATLPPTATDTPSTDLTPGPDIPTPTAGTPTETPTSTPELPPPTYETPVPIPTNLRETVKFLTVTIRMRDCTVALEAVSMDFGGVRGHPGDPDMFRIKLLDFSDKVVGEIRTWDPRILVVYNTEADGILNEQFTYQEEVTTSFFIPFVPNLVAVQLTDPWQYVYLTIDLHSTIASFCQVNPIDDECTAWLQAVSQPTPTPTP